MIEYIKKRDGRKVLFDKNCITKAIFAAASEVAEKENTEPNYEIAEGVAAQVVSLLNKKFVDKIPTVEDIQDAVVKVLIENGHAKTSEAFILYRNERSRIRNSKSRLMKAIGKITFEDASDANIKRENANIDGNTAMGTMLQYGSTVSKEFCKTFVIKPEHAQAHDCGDIHIHDMDFLNMGTLTCCQINLDKLFDGGFSTGHGFLREPNSIMSYGALAAIAIQSNQNDQHGGQSIPFFDYSLAKGVYKTFRKSYIANLYKGLKLLKGIDDKRAIQDIVYDTEKSSNKKVGLEKDLDYLYIEKEKLIETFNIDESLAVLMQSFAYEEAYKETDRQTYQSMEGFIHNLNTMHSRAGAQVPFSSINFGTDTSLEGRMVSKNLLLSLEKGLGNGETAIFPILIFKVKEGVNLNPEDPNYDLFKLSCRVSAKRLFPNVRKKITDVQEWGFLYNKYHSYNYNSNELRANLIDLLKDEDVTKPAGIIPYLLSERGVHDEKTLAIRAFSEAQKIKKYEEQKGICPKCGKGFDYSEMEGDHIIPWSKGGKTSYDNLQMLCKRCNATKSDR